MGRGGRASRWAAGYVLAVGFAVIAVVALSGNEDPAGARDAGRNRGASAPAAMQQATPAPTSVPTATPRPVGTDAEYARGMCLAMDRFFKDVESQTRSITPADPAGVAREFAAAFGPPLARFAEDMKRMGPPADVVAWHDKAAEDLGGIAARIQAGEGLTEIARLGDRPLPELPEEIGARIAVAAHATAECRPFPDAFGG